MIVSGSVAAAGAAVLLALSPCPPMPDDSYSSLDGEASVVAVDMQGGWAVARPDADRPPANAGGGDPGLVGAWDEPIPFPRTAIHATLLPTGKVLQYFRVPQGGEQTPAWVWDPETGAFDYFAWNRDLFCSGLSVLPDGRIYVTGGTEGICSPTQGIRDTHLFDPYDFSWTPLESMHEGRYYPTNVTLGDGSVLIFAGFSHLCETNRTVERYVPGEGLQLLDADIGLRFYPRIHLLTSGKVAIVGEGRTTRTFDVETGFEVIADSNHGLRTQGTSVLLPGRTDQIMIMGGGDPPPVIGTCEIIDFGDPEPQWQYTTPMFNARAHADALILPDKTVLLVGGGANGLYGDPIKTPEIFDPETETWLEVAPHQYPRMYHATTVLLPDGRVLSAGQDGGDEASDVWGEVYSPPYLFHGERPTITQAPPQATYGVPLTIQTPDAAAIESVVLVRLTSVTHSVNMEQRLVELDFELAGEGVLSATGPIGPDHAPPGFYMLFILNGDAVPSRSTMVQLLPRVVGDVDGDGVVDFRDVLLLLSTWGACPEEPEPCPADLDGDGVVDFQDLLLLLSNWTGP